MTIVNGEIISDVLLQLYSIPSDSNFFETTLRLVEEQIPCLVSGYFMIDLATETLRMKTLRQRGGAIVGNLSTMEKLIRTHPVRDVCYQNTMGPVVRTIDLLPEREWKATPLYNEVHRKLGLVHDTSMRFYMNSLCVSFAFCDKVPLNLNSCHFLNLIAPHLSPAYNLFQRQQNEKRDKQIPNNTVMISTTGCCSEPSPSIIQFLDNYYPTEKYSVTHRLPEEIQRWFKQECRKVFPNQQLITRSLNSMLTLRLRHASQGFLILFEESVKNDPLITLHNMGLTKRESEVMLWVAQGKQNSEVAIILGISPGTVRKHVEHILDKLMCETRGAASSMVLQKLTEQAPPI